MMDDVNFDLKLFNFSGSNFVYTFFVSLKLEA